MTKPAQVWNTSAHIPQATEVIYESFLLGTGATAAHPTSSRFGVAPRCILMASATEQVHLPRMFFSSVHCFLVACAILFRKILWQKALQQSKSYGIYIQSSHQDLFQLGMASACRCTVLTRSSQMCDNSPRQPPQANRQFPHPQECVRCASALM